MALTKISTGGVKDDAVSADKLAKPIDLADNEKIRLGTGNDLEIYHSGTSSYIQDNGTGDLIIRASDQLKIQETDGGETMAVFNKDGAVELYNNNSKKFHTTAGGAYVTGTLDTTDTISSGNSNIKIDGDTGKFLAGAGNDLEIYHDGTKSYLKSSVELRVKMGSEDAVIVKPNDAVVLCYDNNIKLETTSAGVSVTGTVSDSKGDLRKIIQNTQGSAYSLVASDAGKHILASGDITVPNSVFSAGDAVTIVNNTSGDITLYMNITTRYSAADGSTVSNFTLASRGVATLLFASGTVCYGSGAGLS